TCYFFREYGYHLHLHSFPTRRSSDLPRCEAEVPLTPYAADGLSAPFQAAFAPSGPAIRRCSYREGVHCAGRCFIPVGAAPPLRSAGALDSLCRRRPECSLPGRICAERSGDPAALLQGECALRWLMLHPRRSSALAAKRRCL